MLIPLGTDGGTGAPWRDPKRKAWLWALFIPTCGLLVLPTVWLLGFLGPLKYLAPLVWWLGPVIVYLVVPLLDRRLGEDRSNPPAEQLRRLEESRYYRWITFLYVPCHLISLVVACQLITVDSSSWLGGVYAISAPLDWFSSLGLTLSIGVMTGVGINVAHELGHKKVRGERRLAKAALAPAAYGHFFIEHNRGHHVRVATPEDPASARFGESFWEFLPRSVIGGVRSAWRLEKVRLQRRGGRVWSIHNDVLSAWAMTVVLYSALIAVFGWGAAPFLIIQALFGIGLLEAVNYIEHYGLLRARTPSGRYERCTPAHSWNSDRIATSVFMIHLQRHSDHHTNPTRRYQVLRSAQEAPQLPLGYAGLLPRVYVPRWWRRTMDHRVLAHYDGDPTRMNIHPRLRTAVLDGRAAVVPERRTG